MWVNAQMCINNWKVTSLYIERDGGGGGGGGPPVKPIICQFGWVGGGGGGETSNMGVGWGEGRLWNLC